MSYNEIIRSFVTYGENFAGPILPETESTLSVFATYKKSDNWSMPKMITTKLGEIAGKLREIP